MYKIKFQEHTLFMSDDVCSFHIRTIQKKKAVVYNYTGKVKLRKIIDEISQSKIKNHILYTDDLDFTFQEFKECFLEIQAAGGLVINEKNQILFIYRHSKWDLPKGKVEKKETFELAAIREVEEETGVKISVLKKKIITTYHTYFQDGKHILKSNHWFLMLADSNQNLQPQIVESIEKVEWKEESQLAEILDHSYDSILDVIHAFQNP